MTHDTAILRAQAIAGNVLAPSAGQNNKRGPFYEKMCHPWLRSCVG